MRELDGKHYEFEVWEHNPVLGGTNVLGPTPQVSFRVRRRFFKPKEVARQILLLL